MLSFRNEATKIGLDWNANAIDIKTALEGLGTIGTVAVSVGSASRTFDITFTSDMG